MRAPVPTISALLLLVVAPCFTAETPACDTRSFNAVTILTPKVPKLGQTVNATCRDGYVFKEEAFKDQSYVSLTCLSKGWNAAQIPSCTAPFISKEIEQNCDSLLIPVADGNRTLITGNGTSYGTIYRYYCMPGYRVVGTPIIQCKNMWLNLGAKKAEPTCERVKCRLPPPSAELSYNLTLADDLQIDSLTTLDVTCATGYKRWGPSKITCSEKGLFDEMAGCVDIDECMMSTNSCSHQCYNTAGSFRCLCNHGYNVSSSDRTMCTDVNECDTISELCPNGTCQNDVGTGYSCACDGDAGYVLYASNGTEGYVVPKEEASLSNAKTMFWINHTCVLRQCLFTNENPENGQLLGYQDTYHVGDVIGVQCMLGYVLTDAQTITCSANGTWSASLPQCVAVTCMPNSGSVDVGNGTLELASGTDNMYGALYNVTCHMDALATGMTGLANNTAMCGADGNWQLGTAYCQPPPFPCNYTKLENMTNVGAIADTASKTLEDCESNCTARVACVAYEWKMTTTECSIYSSINSSTFSVNSMSDFYQKNCSYATTTTTSVTRTTEHCSSASCLNGGTCKRDTDGYKCMCKAGYSGTDCFDNTSCDKAPSTCPHCIPNLSDGGRLCRCSGALKPDPSISRTGKWWEMYAELSTDCVQNDPCGMAGLCQNGGKCAPSEDLETYTCTCATGYQGRNCQVGKVGKDDCKSDSCQNGGVCIDKPNPYRCKCLNAKDFYSANQCKLGCDANPCKAAQTNSTGCVSLLDEYYCPCIPGYTGKECQTPVDLCADGVCGAGKMGCKNMHTSISCTCTTGWTGTFCDQVISACSSSPCSSGATCYDLFDSYYCACDSETGSECSPDFRHCDDTIGCYGNSSCVENTMHHNFSCSCGPGVVGEQCFYTMDMCKSFCTSNPMGVCITMDPGLGNLICKTKDEDPKQLVMKKAVMDDWEDATSVSKACGMECDEINTALSGQLGTHHYLGMTPSNDGHSYIHLDYFAFGSQVKDIANITMGLNIYVEAISIYKTLAKTVSPLYGPIAGGTLLTITGYNFHQDSMVKLGSTSCPVPKRSSVILICSTPPGTQAQLLTSQSAPITVVTGSETIQTRKNFIYKDNPVILSLLSSSISILSGGIKLEVNGTNLDSVSRPQLRTEFMNKTNGEKKLFLTECKVKSPMIMACLTPNITGSSILSTRRRREASRPHPRARRSIDNVELTLGFNLDGVKTFRDFGTLMVYPDPSIEELLGTDATVTLRAFWPFQEKLIQIKGSNLMPNIIKDLFNVLVGEYKCKITKVTSTQIDCEPDFTTANSSTDQRGPDHKIPVTVTIGNIYETVGHVIYIRAISEYLPAIYVISALCAAVLISILLIVVGCYFYRRKHPKRKQPRVRNGPGVSCDDYIPRATRYTIRPGSISNQQRAAWDCNSISTFGGYSQVNDEHVEMKNGKSRRHGDSRRDGRDFQHSDRHISLYASHSIDHREGSLKGRRNTRNPGRHVGYSLDSRDSRDSHDSRYTSWRQVPHVSHKLSHYAGRNGDRHHDSRYHDSRYHDSPRHESRHHGSRYVDGPSNRHGASRRYDDHYSSLDYEMNR